MAGPVWDSKTNSATGFGVKLIVDHILQTKPEHRNPIIDNLTADEIIL